LIKKFERLLDTLKSKNILDKSLIIITSDYRQLLGEIERFGHGTFLDDGLINVPYVYKSP